MTEEDFDDIENRLPFVLTSDESGSTTSSTSASKSRTN
jgi:hypothetical protein